MTVLLLTPPADTTPDHAINPVRFDNEFTRIVDELTRRGFLGGLAGTAGLLGLAACGSADNPATSSGSASPHSWSWTDATGKRIALDATPKRLVVTNGLLESLWDFGLRPVGCLGAKPAGAFLKTSFTRIPKADLDKITFCGGADGVNAEQVLALSPDLVLAEWDTPSKSYWGFGNAQSTATDINKVCPVGGVDITGPAPELLGHMRDLAVTLGAAATGPDVTTAVNTFHQASAALTKAIAAKPGLRVALLSGDDTSANLGNPKGMTDLAYYQQLGLNLVLGPQGTDTAAATTSYWSDSISWENIGTYPVDLLLLTANSDVSALEKIATYQRLPAVAAKQTAVYAQLPAPSYLTYADHMNSLATAIQAAHVLT